MGGERVGESWRGGEMNRTNLSGTIEPERGKRKREHVRKREGQRIRYIERLMEIISIFS